MNKMAKNIPELARIGEKYMNELLEDASTEFVFAVNELEHVLTDYHPVDRGISMEKRDKVQEAFTAYLNQRKKYKDLGLDHSQQDSGLQGTLDLLRSWGDSGLDLILGETSSVGEVRTCRSRHES